MASGDDPLADAYNLMGAQGMTGPNPYLEFTGQIPLAGYSGVPTNAQGQPIQSFLDAQNQYNAWNAANPAPAQGTTLNSTPQSQPGGITWQGNKAYTASGQPATPSQIMQNVNQQLGYEPVYGSIGRVSGQEIGAVAVPQAAPQQAAPQQAAPQSQNPIDMRQAYLSALANPGHVTTPGAQILPGTSMTGPVGAGQPSVLAQFLAQQGGKTGAGGYTNMPFFNTLNQLQAKAGAS